MLQVLLKDLLHKIIERELTFFSKVIEWRRHRSWSRNVKALGRAQPSMPAFTAMSKVAIFELR